MPQHLKAAIDAWHMADADARAAEALLNQAWEHQLQQGTPVPPDLVDAVKKARKKANELLSTATDLMSPDHSKGRP
ncbi:hypothetical protein [Caenimonas aquaedulcis]|uniref:Uncharacterized protein n=1 Tax=Caenimonas aquaedulcis TaxID=2793270 RepID=A0A931H1S5_9BURK|nr:hypothetical protein [Caenimonas aquaedulcis]MBG9386982.1 hypothetical protein [Caenimonas aquaedulcis]